MYGSYRKQDSFNLELSNLCVSPVTKKRPIRIGVMLDLKTVSSFSLPLLNLKKKVRFELNTIIAC